MNTKLQMSYDIEFKVRVADTDAYIIVKESDWNDFVVSSDPAVVAVTTFWVV